MATLTVQSVSRESILDVASGASGFSSAGASGDEWANKGKDFIIVRNGNAADCTVSVPIEGDPACDGQAVGETRDFVVAAGELGVAGPWPVGVYNDTDGTASMTYSVTSSVEVMICRTP
mgnify:CR=1 FL=1